MRKSLSYIILGVIALFSILGSTSKGVSIFLGAVGLALILKGLQEYEKHKKSEMN